MEGCQSLPATVRLASKPGPRWADLSQEVELAHLRPLLCPQNKGEKLLIVFQYGFLSPLSPPERPCCLMHGRRKKEGDENRHGEERGGVLFKSEAVTLKAL